MVHSPGFRFKRFEQSRVKPGETDVPRFFDLVYAHPVNGYLSQAAFN